MGNTLMFIVKRRVWFVNQDVEEGRIGKTESVEVTCQH
jgi:hypothetical protein